MDDLDLPDCSPDALTPTAPATPTLSLVPIAMTRSHWSRLRHYWKGRSRGNGSHFDGMDLELVGAGYVERRGAMGADTLRITPAGELALAAQHQLEVALRKPHEDLASRLAQWLRDSGRVTWENIECRVDQVALGTLAPLHGVDPATVSSHVRPDIYSMAKTTVEENMNPAVHEVKVSRADFLSDISKPHKRLAYATFCEALSYACPAGLIRKDEVPAGCGLVVEHQPGEFEVLVRPKRRRVTLSTRHMMNLVLKPGSLNPL